MKSLAHIIHLTIKEEQEIQKEKDLKTLADFQTNLLLVAQFSQSPDCDITREIRRGLAEELKDIKLPEIESLKLILKAKQKNRTKIVLTAFKNL